MAPDLLRCHIRTASFRGAHSPPALDESLLTSLKGFAEKIQESVPDHYGIGYMHTILCQQGLPLCKTDTTRHTQFCDSMANQIGVGSLWDGQQFVDQPLPYGAFARLIFAYFNNEALLQRTPEISGGPNASTFLRTLGTSSTDGGNVSYTTGSDAGSVLAHARLQRSRQGLHAERRCHRGARNHPSDEPCG